MTKVYLMYDIEDCGEYSGPTDEVMYVADSKDEITRLANDYARRVLKHDDWTDRTYDEFENVVEVDDRYSIRVEEMPFYKEQNKPSFVDQFFAEFLKEKDDDQT